MTDDESDKDDQRQSQAKQCTLCSRPDGQTTRLRGFRAAGHETILICDHCEARAEEARCDFCGRGTQTGRLWASPLDSPFQAQALPKIRLALREPRSGAYPPDNEESSDEQIRYITRLNLDLFSFARAYICRVCVEFFHQLTDDEGDDAPDDR
jgi:hypothetical protein